MEAFSFIFIFSILLVTLYAFIVRKRNYWKNRKVPFIKPTAILGNFAEYIFLRKYIGHVTQEICEAFPDEPYVGTFYGSEPALIVKDPELIKLVMTKDFFYFNSREIAKYTHREVMTQNLFFTHGDRWKVIRQNLTPIFSSAKMRNMFPLIEKCSSVFEELLEYETGMSSVIETRNLTSRFTMDCIGACAFGIDTNTMDKEPTDNPFYQIGHKVIDASTSMALKWIGRTMWPAIFYGVGLQNFPAEADAFFKNVLYKVFKGREEKPSTRNDFIDSILSFKKNKFIVGDSMLNAITADDKKVKLEANDDLLAAQCLVFFLAGYETSSTTSSFTLYELAKNKAAQRRVQDEIDDYLRRHNNKLDYEVVKELVYTQACMDETLRLYPVLPVLTREVVDDYTLPTGLHLEKEMRVHIPVYHIHRNPEYFPEPEKFRPERFLPEEKQNIKSYTYLPFGEGPRVCIGARFAKMQVLAGLVTILKKFDVELAEGMPREIAFDPRGIVSQPTGGVHLKFTPRSPDLQRVFAAH